MHIRDRDEPYITFVPRLVYYLQNYSLFLIHISVFTVVFSLLFTVTGRFEVLALGGLDSYQAQMSLVVANILGQAQTSCGYLYQQVICCCRPARTPASHSTWVFADLFCGADCCDLSEHIDWGGALACIAEWCQGYSRRLPRKSSEVDNCFCLAFSSSAAGWFHKGRNPKAGAWPLQCRRLRGVWTNDVMLLTNRQGDFKSVSLW